MDNFSFNQVTTVISREGVESDFQSYHVTILKMSSSKQKITKHTKIKESMANSQEKRN